MPQALATVKVALGANSGNLVKAYSILRIRKTRCRNLSSPSQPQLFPQFPARVTGLRVRPDLFPALSGQFSPGELSEAETPPPQLQSSRVLAAETGGFLKCPFDTYLCDGFLKKFSRRNVDRQL